jgi:hypothetical protein
LCFRECYAAHAVESLPPDTMGYGCCKLSESDQEKKTAVDLGENLT